MLQAESEKVLKHVHSPVVKSQIPRLEQYSNSRSMVADEVIAQVGLLELVTPLMSQVKSSSAGLVSK